MLFLIFFFFFKLTLPPPGYVSYFIHNVPKLYWSIFKAKTDQNFVVCTAVSKEDMKKFVVLTHKLLSSRSDET